MKEDAFTKDDLVKEFRKLSRQLRQTLQESVSAEISDLRSTMFAMNSPPKPPEVPMKANLSIRSARIPSERPEKDDGGTDSLDFPLFQRGYYAKKMFDQMAPGYGLEPRPSSRASVRSGAIKRNSRNSVMQVVDIPPDLPSAVSDEATEKQNHQICKAESFTTVDMENMPEPRGRQSADSTFASFPNVKPAWGASAGDISFIGGDLRMYGVQRKIRVTRQDTSMHLGSSSVIEDRLIRAKKMSRELVEGHAFDTVSAMFIFFYSCLVGIRTGWMVKNLHEESPVAFDVFEICFCLLFIVEVAIRLLGTRGSFFHSDGWQWTLFDLILVILQILDLVLELIFRGSSGSVGFVRVLRILRLIRIVRIVRMVRVLSEMRCMVTSIISSLRALFFTLVLLGLLVFVMAVFMTQLVNDKLRSNPDDHKAFNDLQPWSSLEMSCLVLFQSLTGGIDWGEALAPLMEHVTPLVAIAYCLYISFAVLCMLNVVTGVFVESACNSSAEEKDASMVARLQSFLCNASNSRITWDEFESHLDDPEILMYFKTIDLDISEARGLFQLLDADNSGSVDPEEFVMGCLRLRGNAKAVDLATLLYENRRWHKRIDGIANKVQTDLDKFSKALSQTSWDSERTSKQSTAVSTYKADGKRSVASSLMRKRSASTGSLADMLSPMQRPHSVREAMTSIASTSTINSYTV